MARPSTRDKSNILLTSFRGEATTYTKRIWLDHADAVSLSAGEEVTLMDWGNAIVKEIEKDQDGNITGLSGVLHLEGSVKTTKLKLTWLPEIDELVSLTLVEFDYLITKKKVCVHPLYFKPIDFYCSEFRKYKFLRKVRCCLV